jgi:hypothetical protein
VDVAITVEEDVVPKSFWQVDGGTKFDQFFPPKNSLDDMPISAHLTQDDDDHTKTVSDNEYSTDATHTPSDSSTLFGTLQPVYPV